MKKKLQAALMLVFLVECVVFIAWWNVTKPRVLILHSYDAQYAWADQINHGLRRVLDAKSDWSLRWHYMDTKRHPWEDYITRAGVGARRVVEEWRPDLVIAVDDEAQSQVMKHYVGRPDMQIVFAGINGDREPYGYVGADNVTGIYERVPWGALKDALLASNLAADKPALRLLHLGDATDSVKEDARHLQQFDWTPLILVDVAFADSFDDWKARVLAAPEQADVILVGNYRGLPARPGGTELVAAREVVAWTEANSALPVVGFKVAYGEEGGALVVSASPYEQGEVAASMAVRILEEGTPAPRIPVESTSQFVVSMRHAALEARGLRLPALYRAFAHATQTNR